MKPEFFNVPQDNLELLNLWENLKEKFSINDIKPFFYQGVTALSEFITYDPTILYLCTDMFVSASGSVSTNIAFQVTTLYDETNTQSLYLTGTFVYWDSTSAFPRYVAQNENCKNFYFGRAVFGTNQTHVKINGYKITLNT